MAISTEQKQQILLDSFDLLKDDWESNKKTLTSSIVKMSKIDVGISIQMWQYLLQRHSDSVKTDTYLVGEFHRELTESTIRNHQYGAKINNDLIHNSFIMETVFQNGVAPWQLFGLVCYLIEISDFKNVNFIFELTAQNHNIQNVDLQSYRSIANETNLYQTNLARMIYASLWWTNITLSDEAAGFYLMWIDRIDDKRERAKLRVLLLSKESDE